jgi:hypothetical protein
MSPQIHRAYLPNRHADEFHSPDFTEKRSRTHHHPHTKKKKIEGHKLSPKKSPKIAHPIILYSAPGTTTRSLL